MLISFKKKIINQFSTAHPHLDHWCAVAYPSWHTGLVTSQLQVKMQDKSK